MKRLILIFCLLFVAQESFGQYDIVRRKIQDQGGQVYSVKAYGAKGDGTTDDRTAIQYTLDTVAYYGGGTVCVPEGTYRVTKRTHPLDATVSTALIISSNTKLLLDQGAIIKRDTSQGDEAYILINLHTVAGDSNIVIEGGIWDGNGANNDVTATSCQFGMALFMTSNSTIRDLTITGIRGTLSYPSGESFHLTLSSCSDITISNVICEGKDYSSSGFSYNGSTNVTTSNCKAYSFGIAAGFTQWHCSNMTYVNCISYNNELSGFNCEQSSNTIYNGCIGGGIASSYATRTMTARDTLGNYYGFSNLGTEADTNTTTQYIGCIANYNIAGLGTNTDHNLRIVGGDYSHNDIGMNIVYSDGNFKIEGEPLFKNNRLTDIYYNHYWTWEDFRDSAIVWNTSDTNVYFSGGNLNINNTVFSDFYMVQIGDGGRDARILATGLHGSNTGAVYYVDDGVSKGSFGNINPIIGGEASTDDIMIQADESDLRLHAYGNHGIIFATNQWGLERLKIDSLGRFNFYNNDLEDIDTIYAVSISLSGAPSYGSPLTVGSGGTGASTLTGLLKGNGTGAVTAITAGTSAQFVRGDFTVQNLNQAAVTGLTTSDTPTFEGVIVGGSATATAGSIKYSGGHLYFYNGAGWVQLAETP